MNLYTHRYKIWLMLEAETPLSIGSGREGLTTDRLVARNAAGFPYIPGTGLAGALRAALEASETNTDWEDIWGDKNPKKEKRGKEEIDITRGSRLIVNSAHLLAANGQSVLEGLAAVDKEHPYYQHLNALPVRDHVRMDDRGVAMDKGKFDEQVCYKGVRFVGSLELVGNAQDSDIWKLICNQLASPFFRLGGGTRKGFGKLKIVHQYSEIYDLTDAMQRKVYLETENSLQVPIRKWQSPNLKAPETNEYELYEISLQPRDFFFFGAGYGDDEADDCYKTERRIEWNGDHAKISDEKILIPASSIKGALRHRVAYHYNKVTKKFIDEDAHPEAVLLEEKLLELEQIALIAEGVDSESERWDKAMEDISNLSFEPRKKRKQGKDRTDPASENRAVKALFGNAAEKSAAGEEKGQRGNVFISDCFLDKKSEKIFDHVRIDRFTGGASDGALFQEKTVAGMSNFKLEIIVTKSAIQESKIKEAWHATLNDLLTGQLPLGGKTTKGHGFFTGMCNVNLKNETKS